MTNMKTIWPMTPFFRAGTLLVALSLSLGACGSDAGSGGGTADAGVDGTTLDGAGLDGVSQADATTDATAGLSQEDQDLTYLREEEKLARDVYLTLYDKWGLNPHKNIAASEQTHTDTVRDLLLKRGLTDPVTDDTVGVFANPVLAKLYTDLVALGSKSEIDALRVGATIEDLDIFDIEEMKKHTTNAEILAVYTALACGSRNHMRSFTGQLTSKGVTYKAQYVTEAELNAIVSGSSETCGGATGGGGGKGGGGKGGGGGGGK